MKTIKRLVVALSRAGVTLSLTDGQLAYRAPQQALTLPIFAELKARKAEAVEYLAKLKARRTIPAVNKSQQTELLPLSAVQLGWIELDKLWGGGVELPCRALRLTGALNPGLIALALEGVANRHDALRARYVRIDGEWMQQIQSTYVSHLEVVELHARAGQEIDDVANEYLLEARHRAFDIEADKRTREILLRLGEDHHVLAFIADHGVIDLQSWPVFLRDFFACYREVVTGHAAQQKLTEIDYADYVSWEAAWLKALARAQLDYWQRQLRKCRAIRLPPDFDAGPSPAVSADGDALDLLLSPRLVSDLRAMARRQAATVQTVLLAVMGLTLSEWTGESDILFGNLVAARPPKMNSVVGAFSRTRPIHISVAPRACFVDILKSTRRAFASASSLRLPTTVELGLERGFYRVSTNFTKHNKRGGRGVVVRVGDVKFGSFPLKRGGRGSQVPHDLQLILSDTPFGMQGYVSYASSKFNRPTIEGFVAAFLAVTTCVVADPSASVSEMLRVAAEAWKPFRTTAKPWSGASDEGEGRAAQLAAAR